VWLVPFGLLNTSQTLNTASVSILRDGIGIFNPNFTLIEMGSITFKEEIMKSRIIAVLLSIVFLLTLALGFTPILCAGGDSTLAHMAGGSWVGNSTVYGTVFYGTTALTNNANGRSASGLLFAASFDFKLYDTFLDVAPVQGPMAFELKVTGPDIYESTSIWYVRNIDQSIAYILIGRGKGRNLNSTTAEENGLTYLFVPGFFTDADNDSLPDDPTQYLAVFPDHTIVRRVASAIPSIPAPDEYPPKP
jgi:hypothetical protein